MRDSIWLLCPECKMKTRVKILSDTELKKFPLYCPKCKRETIIDVKKFETTILKEPDAKTQSR